MLALLTKFATAIRNTLALAINIPDQAPFTGVVGLDTCRMSVVDAVDGSSSTASHCADER